MAFIERRYPTAPAGEGRGGLRGGRRRRHAGLNQAVLAPLYDYPYEQLGPGAAALDELMRELE